MTVFRHSALICLLAGLSLAQSEIDTRGKPYRELSHRLAGGVTVARDQKVLSGKFTMADPARLEPGSHFDYELLVTNDSNASVVVPQTFDWKEIDNGQVSQNFVQANLWLNTGCLNNYSTELDHFVLYGSDDRPGTQLLLKPGDSVRILGSATMPLHSNLTCQSQGTAKFLATFQISAVALRRKPVAGIPEAYSADERMSAIANGKTEYLITGSR